MHGVGTNAHLWRHALGAVAGRARRCIAVDLPLHGASPAAAAQPFGIAAFAVLTNCETHDNIPPKAFKSTFRLARLGILRGTGPRLLRDRALARRRVFGFGYEHVEALRLEVVRSFLDPVLGTRERARQFERWLTSLRAQDLLEIEPRLRALQAPTLVAWGTGDRFFDVRWAHWLAGTPANVTSLVDIPRARLFFPDERAAELVPHLEQHWTRRGVASAAPAAITGMSA